MAEVVRYGEWASPLGAEQVASAGVRLMGLTAADGALYWAEARPSEGGRQAIVRRLADGTTSEVTPNDFNARSRVHEYGGGEHWVADGVVFAMRFDDQRLYRIDQPGEARAITAEPAVPSGDRYADGVVTPDGRWIYCVRERHVEGEEERNEIVVLAADGSDEPRVVASGWDFVSSPRVSPDGTTLCWLSWDHPRMPWDGTELRVAPMLEGGELGEAELVCGGPEESVAQARWSPDGLLHFVSDRSGWWNLYRREADGTETALAPMEAEFAGPAWAFAMSNYAFLDDGTLICSYGSEEGAKLAALPPGTAGVDALEPIECAWSSIGHVQAWADQVAFIGASGTEAAAVIAGPADGSSWEVVTRSRTDELDASYVSIAERITFPTTDGAEAHALFYAPKHAEVVGPSDEQPPLIVMSHGGPTGATSGAYNPAIQFWTTRGFAVVDVDYRGSSGYGREYRRALNGLWGIADVDDCIAAASYLAERGEVDGARMAIRGGSAGGYTTLCALTFHDVFRAGASYFGVADAEALATDTHKFESRYPDGLIGPYPEARETYLERSPIHFADRIRAAVILFQGLEDRIVPPDQAERMVAALDANERPHAYLAFEGEQHGFRQAKNIVATLEAELSFYGQVMGFTPRDVPEVEITHLAGAHE
jgi:dipeptidyl aminopeptidase/acylaminoacyl peptidase